MFKKTIIICVMLLLCNSLVYGRVSMSGTTTLTREVTMIVSENLSDKNNFIVLSGGDKVAVISLLKKDGKLWYKVYIVGNPTAAGWILKEELDKN